MQLQTKGHKQTDRERKSCYLIGMEHGKYLIIKFDRELEGKLPVGTVLILRFLHKGVIYGFRSTILSHLFIPDKLSVISYPDATENMDLRATPRVECFLPAHVVVGKTGLDGPIVDISLKGCSLSLRDDGSIDRDAIKQALNQPIQLSFQLPGIKGYVNLPGILRRCEGPRYNFNLGIQFQSPGDAIKASLYGFLLQVDGLPEGADFAQAIGAHLVWKNKLQLFFDDKGSLSPRELESASSTELGQWLAEVGREKYGAHPDFNALVRCNEQLHDMLKPILEKKARGDGVGAAGAFNAGGFSAQSQKIISILLKMEESAKPQA